MNWKTIEYDNIVSTNVEAKRLVSKGESHGLVIWAHHQTRGRGRHGRVWWNLPGKSILASIVFENIDSGEATRLVSISTIAAIRNFQSKGPAVKWPNDLVYEKKKVGGILSEAIEERGKNYTIVGLGLNLNYSKKDLLMGRRLSATSLMIAEGKSWDNGLLLVNILAEIEKRIYRDKDNNLAEYRDNLAFVGKKISVLLDGKKSSGVFTGVDDSGFLMLDDQSTVRCFPAGEVQKVKI